MSIPTNAFRRVVRELADLQKNPPEGIRIQTNEDNILDLTGIIEGPEGTPYAGGYFRIKFKFTEEFPAAPPKCWFATKIFHPNVSSSGEICVNTLKKDWKSNYGIQHILVTVKCLLIYPNPESALDEEAGKLLLEDYDSYCQRAKLITSVHARGRPKEFDLSSSKEDEDSEASGSKAPSIIAPAPPTSFTLPITSTTTTPSSRKSSSPAPQIGLTAPPTLPLTSSASNKDALTSSAANKERHNSPSPLSTADANVSKPARDATMNAPTAINLPAGANKAVKRAATAVPGGGGEKRKKALKRL